MDYLNLNIVELHKLLVNKEITPLELTKLALEKAKKDFIDKRIKRRSLEVLKENKILEIKKEEERLEQISNDEFALYAHMRKIGKEVKEHGFR